MKRKQKINSTTLLLLCVVGALTYLLFVKQPNDPTNNGNGETSSALTTNDATCGDSNNHIPNIEIPVNSHPQHEQQIQHLGYTVGYNQQYKIPNWVAYELTAEETSGVEERARHFVPDPQLERIYSADTKDYSNSGYDRGHMAPAADMKWSEQAMKESFYLSNICPQNHNLNSGDWLALEDMARTWANKHGKLYVVSGPIVSPNHKSIGQNNVAVPDAFYKIFLQQRGETYYAIAFLCPNESGHKKLSSYAVSIDEIEEKTHLDFFSLLEDELENTLESTIDLYSWQLK